MSAVSADDRAAALGQLFRGIVHEAANVLNVILMNAQLAEISPEDAAASLTTIGDQARDGGEFLKSLSAFAGADDFSPTTRATIADCVALSRSLLGSTPRRCGTTFSVGETDGAARQLDRTGLAIVVALLISEVCNRGAGAVDVMTEAAVDGAVDIVIKITGADILEKEPNESLGLRLADALCRDHGGSLITTQDGWRLRLAA